VLINHNKTLDNLSFFQNPHLVFIESSCPAFLSKYSDGGLFIYSKESYKFSPHGQRTLVVPSYLMRYLKILGALFRFSCTYQGAYGIAYNLSKNKSVISDGILTEWLYKKGHIKPHKFISIADLEPSIPVKENIQLILGNNWYEFGTFSFQRNEAYLKILKKSYPDACYYPHPKEGRVLPRKIFGPKLIEPVDNIETFCNRNGVPRYLIGFLGSTAMASLGKLAKSNMTIEAIKFNSSDCDGPKGDVTDPFLQKKRGIKITLSDIEETVENILNGVQTVSIREKKIFFS
jgi:hypothetical protein